MKTKPQARSGVAFTLIELLVVIAVIGLLAGLLLPVMGAVRRNAVKTRTRAELKAVVFAIEAYKEKLGHYPPDSANPLVNQLYFELLGTRLIKENNTDFFETLDGSARIRVNPDAANGLKATFGSRVTGFVNCTRAANADDAPAAKAFIKSLKPNQSAEIADGVRVLACPVQWPLTLPKLIAGGPDGINPWRYVSTNPTNNPGRFDLWVDVLIGGKTNRISNWSEQPQIVNTP